MTKTLEEVIGKEHIEALRRPIDDARGLPGAAYTTPRWDGGAVAWRGKRLEPGFQQPN